MSKDELIKFLPMMKKKAEDLGMDWVKDIQISPLKLKKYRILLRDDCSLRERDCSLRGRSSHVDFGRFGMEDFLIHQSKKRRDAFHARFKNNPSYNDPESGLYYSARLLWP